MKHAFIVVENICIHTKLKYTVHRYADTHVAEEQNLMPVPEHGQQTMVHTPRQTPNFLDFGKAFSSVSQYPGQNVQHTAG